MTSKDHNSGLLHVAASSAGSLEEVVRDLSAALSPFDPRLVLWFCSSIHPFPALAEAVHSAFPDASTVGCTTMGEIGPLGLTQGGVSAIGLGEPLRAGATLVEDLSGFRFEDGRALVRDLAHQLDTTLDRLSLDQHVFITLTDGLSGMEDILVASLATHAPGVPLVGGSAGDDFHFERTWVGLDGRARSGAAVVLLLQPGVPFHPFQVHHYHPTQDRVVVTDADPKRRIVRELDGWPAVRVMARLLDIPEDYLNDDPVEVVANHSATFAVRVGGSWCLRSVMTVRDGALLMGGAIEEGTVLRAMFRGDLVEETRAGVEEALLKVSEPAGMIVFNCGGRMMEAQVAGTEQDLAQAILSIPTAGFTTYGEQFGPLQVNHTLTGLVFGSPDA